MTSPSSSEASSWFSWLIQSNPDVYYPGVTIIYAIASFLALGLYIWEAFLMSRPPTEFEASFDGLYLVLMPYVPGLIWVAAMTLRLQRNLRQAESSTTKGKQD